MTSNQPPDVPELPEGTPAGFRLPKMPASVRLGVIALGVSGVGLLLGGLYGVLGDAGSTGLRELGALLGIAELLVVGRVIERRQAARMTAMTMCLVQSLGGVLALADGQPLGLLVIVLASLIVVPLSLPTAERYFEAAP